MAASVADVVEPHALGVLRATADLLAAQTGGAFDARRAMGDLDAVRGLATTLGRSPALRSRLRTTHEHALLDADDQAAARAADDLLADIKARGDSARRAERAQRRGTAEERRTARADAERARQRTERERAVVRALAAEQTIEKLRGQIDELDEALRSESDRADTNAAAAEATRASLNDPRILARHLSAALANDSGPLEAAAVAVPDEDRPAALKLVTALLDELAHPRIGRARTVARALAVEMLGGGTEVGGSCALVTAGDTRLLVDAGTRPGAQTAAEMAPPRLATALAAGGVDAIILTHGHADHIGWVPAVLAQFPGTPIYASLGTADLLATMWQDSVKIFQRDRDLAPYNEGDVRAALAQVTAVPFGQHVQAGDLSFRMFPAGHIVGAAGVALTDGHSRVVVSGDVSGPGQKTVGGWDLPDDCRNPDLLVLEATYGATTIPATRARVVEDFLRDVEFTVSNGGRVLVPAFAIGRAQEIALLCAERLPDVPVRIDGLARDITGLYEKHADADGKRMSIWSSTIRPVPRGRTSTEVETFRSGVVITTSGMLTAGPALRWARSILPDQHSALAIVGYQDPNSPGGRLLRLAPGDTWELTGDSGPTQVEVNATVRQYGLGAHASSDELVSIATHVRAATTMLVHGDAGARQALGERLAARHLTTADAAHTWRATR